MFLKKMFSKVCLLSAVSLYAASSFAQLAGSSPEKALSCKYVPVLSFCLKLKKATVLKYLM